MTDLRADAQEVLESNRRQGYTVPAGDLYPYQWNWDSAFIAIGLAAFDPAAAKEEIETLLSATWPNGMVPQTAFWQDDDEYFPGPDVWEIEVPVREGLQTPVSDRETVQTSGTTQPPMVVPAAREVYETTGDEEFRERVRPVLDDALSWWWDERGESGLVWTRHPRSTGMPDSPAWIDPLDAIDPDVVEGIEGTEGIENESESDRWDDERLRVLLQQGKALDWDEEALRDASPFVVVDAMTNALFVRSCEDLAAIHESAGDDKAATTWYERAQTARQAMRDRLWNEKLGTFVSYDLIANEPLSELSVAGLAVLYAGVPTDGQFESMQTTIREEFLDSQYGVPSYVGDAYDLDHSWRGGVWVNTNYLVSEGLARYGALDLAERLRHDATTLVESAGFREYFDPETGDGCGADQFSWSAALWFSMREIG